MGKNGKRGRTVLLLGLSLAVFLAGLIVSIFIFVAPAVFVQGRQSIERLRGERDFNIILITVDTLRADRLGCYGFPRVETPAIDSFAARGVKFENCIAPTPLTLPSHTSLLTGTLPLFHGIRDNGGFVVPPELKTMAEVFKEQGYATAAFVGAYVLDSKWGLDQGFDYYFDRFDLSKFEKISLATVQRPANEVIEEALKWLDGNKKKKFFAWIHLYDPHTPYEPPSPFDARYPNHPYLGEIAFTDSELARLWKYLEEEGLTDNLFLIFASDHGESLGEHEEATHGFFVYKAAIHVPLIFVTPFERFQGLSVPQVVSLIDVMPTMLEMAGFPSPPEVQGKSLLPRFFRPAKDDDTYAYAETFYPRFHFGWSELKSFQDRRFKLIISPDPELYDLELDPDEMKNLVPIEPKLLASLEKRATRFIAAASQNAYELDFRKIDEETREKLAALGYVGSFTDSARLEGKKLANPKDKIGVFNELSRAREMGMSGKADEAIQIIKTIIAEDPDISDAYFALGNIYFKQRNFEEAIAAFEQALERKPDDSFCVINIANSYQMMGQPAEAERFVIDYLKKGFSDSQLYYLLGTLNYNQKKYDEAIKYYSECLSLNADSAASHNALAAIYILREDLERAQEHIDEAMALNPTLTNLNYNLAQILEKRGEIRKAMDAYLRELEHSPAHFKASFNLSRLYRQTGDVDSEEHYLEQTIAAAPEFPLSYFYLARICLNRGENYEEAVRLARKGIDLRPEPKELPLGYFLLADLYSRLGEPALSAEYARKGRELAR
ncbi:MAG: tetratricopeptide repeat protein [Candidatus Aminicenantes bacterium]|nr:tetratricopeptide repeat protein [Candidatus Aminicenantes bacterium]